MTLRTRVLGIIWVVALGFLSAREQPLGAAFIRGDVNHDGGTDISDAVQLLLCLFLGDSCSGCEDARDANDDSAVDVTDAIYLLDFLFQGGAVPPTPGGDCGTDPTPDDLDCPLVPVCAPGDTVPTSRGPLVVLPVDHASLVLFWDNRTIYVDPVGGAGPYVGLPAADLVVVTHTHGDHLHADTLQSVVDEHTAMVMPLAVAEGLAGSGVTDVVEDHVLENGDTIGIDDITVEAVPMYNLTPERLRYHEKGVGNGYVLDLDGTRVYISGDTEDTPEMRALRDIDLAFLCMNLPYTMTPGQAASAALEFQPRVVYPYHYRGQDPGTFQTLVEAESLDIEVRLREWYP